MIPLVYEDHGRTYCYHEKHNNSYTRTYKTWSSMKYRCYNPNYKGFKHYGGRNIKVCDRWLNSFNNFLSDMGIRPSNTSLDRINNNGDYSKENCRWATHTQQMNNRNYCKYIEAFGKKQTLTQWAKEIGISQPALSYRLKANWAVERALTEKLKR